MSENKTEPCLQARIVDAEFTPDQRALITDLLLAERRHASRWWTYLNEMRMARQLPEWCADKKDVGGHLDYDAWEKDCSATSWALLRFSGHLNRYNPLSDHEFIELCEGRWSTLDDTSEPE
ncbi:MULTISPECIES: hypothetical protein [Pseudomonas]|uniref:hypothetical protein n=1 Tax=Pseudomonas TaxID=286 RepID=UPI000B876938|nr:MULTISPECIES: hypothetical protein [Pseudomonas]RXU25523.1 hypothetical protein B0A92_10345 [Pseudomonas syringae]